MNEIFYVVIPTYYGGDRYGNHDGSGDGSGIVNACGNGNNSHSYGGGGGLSNNPGFRDNSDGSGYGASLPLLFNNYSIIFSKAYYKQN